MPLLKPEEAAHIALGAYRLRDAGPQNGGGLGCEDLFAVGAGTRLEGHAGGFRRRPLGALGYVAQGVGPYAGEVLVATRGTAMRLDWLSNLNVGIAIGPGGMPVHAGFHEVWKSFAHELDRAALAGHPSRIHCVGHSLGGALASLNADHFSQLGAAEVVLYTFGAPRCGDGLFSRALSGRMGSANILRVWHPADPVAMIPVFPFWHLPFRERGLQLPAAGLVSVGAHRLEDGYLPLLRGQTWSTLAAASAARADEASEVQAWLQRVRAGGPATFRVGSAALLAMIGRALRWLLERVRDVLTGSIGLTLAVGATLLDQLAWLLARGAGLARDLGDHLQALVGAIFGFLGRRAPPGQDAGPAFVRWVLGLLHDGVAVVAARALAFAG